MKNKINILVCPLNWGLGHATRCIPVIEELLSKDVNVIIAGSGNSLKLLKQEFPLLESIYFEDYLITYPKNKKMVLHMFLKVPSIIYRIFKEHRKVSTIIKRYKIDAIISDNRYGLFSKKIPSVFITHQIMIKAPIWLKPIEPLLFLINICFISKFTYCWVPDFRGKINFSGDLSHKYPKLNNVHYIGPQSRFAKNQTENADNKYCSDLLVVLSGPEPQRSIFEAMVLKQLQEFHLKTIVVLGRTDNFNKEVLNSNLTIFSYLKSTELAKYIQATNLILCRAGYSSIIDICSLGKKAILIPTPGQTEQEYLAKYFFKKKIFYSQSQSDFDLCIAIKQSENYSGFRYKTNKSLLSRNIESLLVKIRLSKH